jgi:lactoylglutathione lyase
MIVERVKYIIWAKETPRAVAFYRDHFGGRVIRENDHIAELEISGTTLAIHSGGEDDSTWTGLAFQVADVVVAAQEVVAAGGSLSHEPTSDEPGEPPHLAMCADPEGNRIMLTRKRA